ncbi:type III PLP-dependent enzyme domain-containing protein [Ulvibacterium marinum]|uniref:Y4yA family PLP-dependent enzyme n=1 Tax=Ulvibacterium marinum TaxID=2419782 RepID=A0A3B0CGK5_9FLAO|nr:Y4yA family PLP-dependent enzyme [Ulvibacterium marinum]RKN83499.1 Y4yA family PLP-dependent enzyme [Ulvibacterium marinum]
MQIETIDNKVNYSENLGEFPLSPIISEWMESILNKPILLRSLTKEHGSTINIHHLSSFDKNVDDYRKVFMTYELDGKVYFARKANKSKALVKRALESGVGVDTASREELAQAIELGGGHDNLVLTAAIKTRPMIELALRNNVPIIIDNEDELILVNDLANSLGRIAAIGLRLSGFKFKNKKLYSRFGFDVNLDKGWLKRWFNDDPRFHNLKLIGLHFHLDGYSTAQRAEGILQSLEFKEYLSVGGQTIRFLDIGGGILMNYLRDKQQWQDFNSALKQAVFGDRRPLTFGNDGLGYEKNHTTKSITGNLQTYPYYNDINKTSFLKEILDYTPGFGLDTVADTIRRNGMQLRIEPGRSLLDQVGMTIAKVAHRKKDSNGDWLVGLEMNMSQLRSSSRDFLVDPYLVYNREPEETKNTSMYFTGAYCLEQDVILKRKFTFPGLPGIGDHIAFINTGGYMMHFYETEAHLFALSTNLYCTADRLVDGTSIYRDDQL